MDVIYYDIVISIVESHSKDRIDNIGLNENLIF